MPHLVFKPTQRLRVLTRLLTQPEVRVYELMTPRPNGEGVAQYNARIKELRDYGYRIENVEPGVFTLNRQSLEKVIEDLRIDFQLASGARRQQIAAEGILVKKHLPQDEFIQEVKEALWKEVR